MLSISMILMALAMHIIATPPRIILLPIGLTLVATSTPSPTPEPTCTPTPEEHEQEHEAERITMERRPIYARR
jgi:hypothetical protein